MAGERPALRSWETERHPLLWLWKEPSAQQGLCPVLGSSMPCLCLLGLHPHWRHTYVPLASGFVSGDEDRTGLLALGKEIPESRCELSCDLLACQAEADPSRTSSSHLALPHLWQGLETCCGRTCCAAHEPGQALCSIAGTTGHRNILMPLASCPGLCASLVGVGGPFLLPQSEHCLVH